MTTLTLSIKEQYLKELIAGTKTEDYREASPYNTAKFCHMDKDGKIKGVKSFDKVRFYTGKYTKGKARPFAEFKVKEIFIETVKDEAGGEDFEFTIVIGKLLANNFTPKK